MTSILILHSLLSQPSACSLSGAASSAGQGTGGPGSSLPGQANRPSGGQAMVQSIWVSYLTALNQLCQRTGHRTQVAQDSSLGVRRWVQERGAAFPPEGQAGATDHQRREAELPKCMERRVRGG